MGGLNINIRAGLTHNVVFLLVLPTLELIWAMAEPVPSKVGHHLAEIL